MGACNEKPSAATCANHYRGYLSPAQVEGANLRMRGVCDKEKKDIHTSYQGFVSPAHAARKLADAVEANRAQFAAREAEINAHFRDYVDPDTHRGQSRAWPPRSASPATPSSPPRGPGSGPRVPAPCGMPSRRASAPCAAPSAASRRSWIRGSTSAPSARPRRTPAGRPRPGSPAGSRRGRSRRRRRPSRPRSRGSTRATWPPRMLGGRSRRGCRVYGRQARPA